MIEQVAGTAPCTEARVRAMGTDVYVIAVDGPRDLSAWVAERLERLESRWSRFRPSSELCQLNAAAGHPIVVSRSTYEVVARAVDAWRWTAGRYDPSVLSALVASGYDRDFDDVDPVGDGPPPKPVPAPGCAGIGLDPMTRSIRLPLGVGLDLGGIGKGYAADLLATETVAAGALGALVNLGGDVRAAGALPSDGWIVDVEDPLDAGLGQLAVTEGGIATSTSLRRTWSRGDEQLHHLVDPTTGKPATTGLVSVTVIAGECWRAEVLAKAAFVAGPVAGRKIINEAGASGLFLHDDGHIDELARLDAFRP
ncbi:MAG TPA: FAD:protein FMN transferase [Acidimicrobiia bacterium]